MATRKPVARKPVASEVGIATQAAGVTTMADAKPVTKLTRQKGETAAQFHSRVQDFNAALKPAKRAAKGSPALKEALDTIAKQPPTPKRPVKSAALVKADRLNKAAVTKGYASKADPKPVKVKAAAVKYKGIVIPAKRKNGDDESDVPTIQVKNVNETVKVFAVLPKGCTWLADGGKKDTLSVFNGNGALIAELRITLK